MEIPEQERTLAAVTHLSGLAGYVIPLGGVVAPIVIWVVKSDSRVVSSVAKQALLLNVIVWLLIGVLALLSLTVILMPVTIPLVLVLMGVAIVLPIVGAVKAFDGIYYTYPVVGIAP